MIEGKTKSGFKFKITDEALNNMELLDLLAEIDGGRAELAGKAAEMLLGSKQKKALYDHLRTKKGNVPVEKFTDELLEILKSKNC